MAQEFVNILHDPEAIMEQAQQATNPASFLPGKGSKHWPSMKKQKAKSPEIVIEEQEEIAHEEQEEIVHEEQEEIVNEPGTNEVNAETEIHPGNANGPAKRKRGRPAGGAKKKARTRKPKGAAPDIDDDAMVANIVLVAKVIEYCRVQCRANPDLGPVPPSLGNLSRYMVKNPPVLISATPAIRKCQGCKGPITTEDKKHPNNLLFQKKWYF